MSVTDERAVLAVLVRALERVSSGWCQGENARDADGKACSPRSERAVAWCIRGATCLEPRFSWYQWRAEAIIRENLPSQAAVPGADVRFNDDPNRIQEEVVEVVRRAVGAQRLVVARAEGHAEPVR